MSETLQWLLQHGYAAIAVYVLAKQLGLPLPAAPVLVAAGALAGSGELGFAQVIGLALLASLAADVLWYEIGRRYGRRVLRFLCHRSLEPGSCVRRTEGAFVRTGAWSLVVAKFVPGLSTVAPPLAGMVRIRLWRFLLLDGAGILAWALAYAGLGYLFGHPLERIAQWSWRMGTWHCGG